MVIAKLYPREAQRFGATKLSTKAATYMQPSLEICTRDKLKQLVSC
jgi:hypothetical protein